MRDPQKRKASTSARKRAVKRIYVRSKNTGPGPSSGGPRISR